MTQVRTVVLDDGAVQVLRDPAHPKHRRVLAVVEAVTARNLRRTGSAQLVVPTSVRVEAGWDRRTPGAAAINRLRVTDQPLDAVAADRAAAVRSALAVSVADAHLAAALETTTAPHAVLTSDVDDLRRIADHLDLTPRLLAV